MAERIGFAWRLCATGFCFALFGIGGLLLAVVIFPTATYLWPGQRKTRWLRVQNMIQYCFRVYLKTVELLGVGKVTVHGAERLADTSGALVLANHPTLLDVVALMSCMPQADCVVKQALWKNPFLGGVVRGAGYVSNASPDAILTECVKLLNENRSLIIFPEGTRSVPGGKLKFQRGAARLALKSGAPIVPVTMTCEPPTLMKNTPWYRIPPKPWHIRLVVHDAVRVSELAGIDRPEPAAVRYLTRQLEEMFERKLVEHEQAC